MRNKKAKQLRRIIEEKFANLEDKAYTKTQVMSKKFGVSEVIHLASSKKSMYKQLKKFYKNGGKA